MRTFLTALLIALCVNSPTQAQPLADRVPGDAVFYFGWRGSDDLGPGYAESHLKAILDQSNFSAVFNDMLPRAIFRIQRLNPQAAGIIQMATGVAGPMWRHPMAIFFSDLQLRGQGPPLPKLGIICKAGSDAPQILSTLQLLLQNQPPNSPVPVRAFLSGDAVVIAVGYDDSEPIFSGSAKSGTLKMDPAFTAAMGQVQKDPVLALYVNFERGCKLFESAITQSGDKNVLEYWPKVRDAAGLAGLKRFIATSGFDGKDWLEQAYIDAPSPRTGLMTMLDAKPVPEALIKQVPQDANQFAACSFDIAKFVSTVRTGIAQVSPEADKRVTQGFGVVSMYIGRDLQKELLEPLGEHWAFYSSPTIAGRGLLGTVLINQLDDPKKTEQGLFAAQAAAFNTIAGFLPREITISAQNMKAGDLSINYIAVPLISPAWAVKGNNLYVAPFPQNIISAARFGASNGKSILDNPKYMALRQRLGGQNVSAIAYVDPLQTAGESYQGLLVISRLLLGAGDIFGVKSPEPVVPPLDVFLQHLDPIGSVAYVDAAGWHSKAISPFPLAQVFAGGSTAAPMIAQMGSALVPLFGGVRTGQILP